MSGHTSQDVELLLSPKDIQRRKRACVSNGYLSEGGAARIESSGELSHSLPVLSDHCLPSERARRAATNRYRELQRSGREEETTNDERTPLLPASSKESVFGSSSTQQIVANGVAERQTSENTHTQSVSHANDLRVSVGGIDTRKERKQLKREK